MGVMHDLQSELTRCLVAQDGHTPLKLAKEARQEQLVDLLKQAYKFNQDAKDGRRPSGLESFSYQYPDPEI